MSGSMGDAVLNRLWLVLVAGALASILLLPGVGFAAPTQPLDFVLGVPGKTGCLVCHGDPQIREAKEQRSLYVNPDDIANSIHKDVACTSCHTDFSVLNATREHETSVPNFRTVAGLSCKNCHQHAEQLKVYGQSVHGRLALSGDKKKGATCGDCHGSHNIRSLKKDAAYAAEFHLDGYDVCGKCHKDYFNKYNDYYHGRAYKAGASDAPACWDCHGSHAIMPAKIPTSMVSPNRLAKTCGQCHVDSQDSFAEYGAMVHGTRKVIQGNFIIKYLNIASSWVGTIGKTVSGGYRSVVSSMFSR